MLPIRLVTLDMAGTTVRDEHEVEHCFARAAKDTGLTVSDERVLALQGYHKHQVFEMLWTEHLGSNHPEWSARVEYSYETFTSILENHYLTHLVYPTEGALELFQWLREQDIRIALTTGFYRKVTNIILEKLGWLKGLDSRYIATGANSIIDVSITSDEVVAGRPEPYMIQKAMATFGITDAAEVINIGDTPSDLKSGTAAGCRLSLGVVNGTHSRQQLEAVPSDGLLENVGELIKVIGGR